LSRYEVPAPPAEFAYLPYLKGRATVDMTIKPGPMHEGGGFDVDGTLFKQVCISIKDPHRATHGQGIYTYIYLPIYLHLSI